MLMGLSWQDGDRIFERLVEISEPMDQDESEAFLARLVFLLANELADGQTVLAAVEAAANSQTPQPGRGAGPTGELKQ
jgi:Protein of unknown function (DUF2783)